MELSVWKQSLDVWFDAHKQDMLTMVERVVNMDSFSHDAADVNRLGEVITGWMAEAGFRTEMLPKRPAPADEPWMASLGVPIPWRPGRAWPSSGTWTRFSPPGQRLPVPSGWTAPPTVPPGRASWT